MVKYLYLDDAAPTGVKPYIREIEKNSDIKIDLRQPHPFDKQIDDLASAEMKRFDGLILDLRLDEQQNHNDERANFRAPAIAQELRSRSIDPSELSYPIVLWSTDEKLKQSYYRDPSAQDLFDLVCTKNDIKTPSARVADKLLALVAGYRKIEKILKQKKKGGRPISASERLRLMLGLRPNHKFLDPRISGYFGDKNSETNVGNYKYARFVLKEIIEEQGPLIDESVLAARLGIDIKASPDWTAFKERFLSNSIYGGIFSEGWERWWTYLVEDWWRTYVKSKTLREINAAQRVTEIRKITKLRRLVAASPLKANYSTRFWTICQVYEGPLSPTDGYIIKNNHRKAWQEYHYVSEKAVKARKLAKLEIEIDPLEQQKL